MNNLKKELLRAGIRPDKKSGQHFLVDSGVLNRIISAADLTRQDIVLEVGAGPGNLTQLLARQVHRVIAVENDSRIIPLLEENLKPCANVEIVKDDIFYWRRCQPGKLTDQGYKLVANIPYYLTAHLLRIFLSEPPKPGSLTLLVQKEVAERIVAAPGEMSQLSVSVQYYSRPKLLFTVAHSHFWPEPKIDSAVVSLSQIKKTVPEDKDFFRLVRIGFTSRRKQLQNNLKAGYRKTDEEITNLFQAANIPKKIRPQELSITDWQNLFSGLKLNKIG